MKSIKSKVFLFFFFFVICIVGLAAYSWVNSKKLTSDIAELANPKRKSILFNEIDSRLSDLISLYLQRETNEIDIYIHNELIDSLKMTVMSLNDLYIGSEEPPDTYLMNIPLVLDSIKTAFEEVAILKDEFQRNFNNRILEKISHNLERADLRDIVFVESSLSTEITRIIEKDIVLLDDSVKEESKNIFQRLFSRKSEATQSNKSRLQQVKLDTTQFTKDSVFITSFDTLFVPEGVEALKRNISGILLSEQIRGEEIRERENKLYFSNIRFISDMEKLIYNYQKGEQDRFRVLANQTLKESIFYQNYILSIICLFGVVSIILLGLLINDINKKRNYQKMLEDSKRQITMRFEQKQRLLNTLSHELRTPLTAIIGFAELIKEGENENKQAILSNSRYLLEMANEILDLAKLEANKVKINKMPTNIYQVIKNIENNMISLINQAKLKPVFEYHQSDLWVLTDPLRLQQIIYNLIHNAVKFTNEGSVSCIMEHEDKDHNKVRLCISIIDTGIGISREEQELIFRDYQQAGTHKHKSKGTGLGLGIVHRLVQLMDGELTVQSTPGLGSCFTISLILDKIHPAEEGIDPGLELTSAKHLMEQKHILAVDDDPYILRLYERIFSDWNCKISTLSNPLEVEAFLLKEKVDLLITDIRMPEKDGITLLKDLKSKDLLPDKVACCSANIYHEDETDMASKKLFNGFLLKPFNIRDIHLLVANVFDEGYLNNDLNTGSKEKKIDLSDLYAFSLNDDVLFEQVVSDYYRQNKEELKVLKDKIAEVKLQEAAELVHKLASRFGQIKAHGIFDPLSIEEKLRNDESSILKTAIKLCKHWEVMNEHLKESLKR